MVMNEEGEDWLTDCEQVFVPEAASNLEYTYKQVKLSEEATCRLRKAVQKKKEKRERRNLKKKDHERSFSEYSLNGSSEQNDWREEKLILRFFYLAKDWTHWKSI